MTTLSFTFLDSLLLIIILVPFNVGDVDICVVYAMKLATSFVTVLSLAQQ